VAGASWVAGTAWPHTHLGLALCSPHSHHTFLFRYTRSLTWASAYWRRHDFLGRRRKTGGGRLHGGLHLSIPGREGDQ